jgi:hypothetical protein
MPPIRRNHFGRRTRNAKNQANYRSNRTAQERDEYYLSLITDNPLIYTTP